MAKLDELSTEELRELEAQLTHKSKNTLDKYKSWEARQKLYLVQRELKQRSGAAGWVKRLKDWFMPPKDKS